jgi:hypothetical protein
MAHIKLVAYIAACVVVPIAWGLLVYKLSGPIERFLARKRTSPVEDSTEYMI